MYRFSKGMIKKKKHYNYINKIIIGVGSIIIMAILTLVIFVQKAQADKQNIQSGICTDTTERCVAITFDDGPNPKSTQRLLDGLKERNVKATFFLVGKNIEGNEDVIKRMYEEGHLIGNHTYTHVQLDTLNVNMAKSEIIQTNEKITEVIGECPKYIRPPFGAYSDKLLSEINMMPMLWSVDPEDWATKDIRGIVNKVTKNIKCGDIILLHDIYDTSVEAALEIIDILQSQGYVFVTADQILLD